MADELKYPLVTGFRHGFASLTAVIKTPDGKTIKYRGFKGVNYNRTRERELVRGNHPDPLGKTQGENSYTADAEVYLAEFNDLITQLGNGYGDIIFMMLVHFVSPPFTGIQDEIHGCTIDSTEATNAQGSAALTRKFNLNPTKILFDGKDDVATPLNAST